MSYSVCGLENSTDEDPSLIEYLDLETFSDEDDEQAFKEFCSTLSFEPFGDQLNEQSPYLSTVSSKRKAGGDSFEQNNAAGKRTKSFVPEKSKKVDKNDIRRQYAQQFADAFNGCDTEVLSSLLHKLCLKDVVLVYKYIGVSNPYGPMNLEILGTEAVCVFWDTLFMAIPDCLFEMHETKIKVLPNGSSCVICKFTYHGTKVFHVDGLVENTHKDVVIHGESKVVGNSSVPMDTNDANEAPSRAPDVDDYGQFGSKQVIANMTGNKGQVTNTVKFGLGETRKAQPVMVVGTLTYFLDITKAIYRMEYVYSIKK